MKTQLKVAALGALLYPLALVGATFIANEAQMLLGLDLDRVALAIYLFGIFVAITAVLDALIHTAAKEIGGGIGKALDGLADKIFEPAGPEQVPLEQIPPELLGHVEGAAAAQPPPPAPPPPPPAP